jgi:hypothetical protein
MFKVLVLVLVRGDFCVHVTGCIARYGTVVDNRTRRPVCGATVAVGGITAGTDPTGWFDATRQP